MIQHLLAAIVMVSFGLSLGGVLHAQEADPFSACKIQYDQHKKIILKDLDRVEQNYIKYRWTEVKLRRLYYERLWQARQDATDPADQEVRTRGRDEEARILQTIESAENDSQSAAAEMLRALRDFQSRDYDVSNACPEKDFKKCFQKAFKPAYELADEIKPSLDSIFEHEREYRSAMMKTAGDKKGLYLEDTLEHPADHDALYWRFEKDHQARRFEEDARIINFLHEIQKILTWKFQGDDCCYECAVQIKDKALESV
ncbi:MAG: hypothetical protein HYZ85_03005 [Candidatus Omnitrophica bacterium]|nr:hypothetical protein [Candidatus Omnitrophota bacterium]